MADTLIVDGHSVPQAAVPPTESIGAAPFRLRIDYDHYRAEARRLRRQARRDMLQRAGAELRRLLTG